MNSHRLPTTEKEGDVKDPAHRDPVSGEPGCHPLGAGVGATAGAVPGAVLGAVGGPAGIAIGAVLGGVAGGLAGKVVAESIHPTAEEAHWRENHLQQSWAEKTFHFDLDYLPAYKMGYFGYGRWGQSWSDAEPELRRAWEADRDGSRLTWDQAKFAAQESWRRRENRGHQQQADADDAPENPPRFVI